MYANITVVRIQGFLAGRARVWDKSLRCREGENAPKKTNENRKKTEALRAFGRSLPACASNTRASEPCTPCRISLRSPRSDKRDCRSSSRHFCRAGRRRSLWWVYGVMASFCLRCPASAHAPRMPPRIPPRQTRPTRLIPQPSPPHADDDARW